MRMLLAPIAGLAMLAGSFTASADVVTLKVSYQFPSTHIVTVHGINVFIREVEERVPGRVQFQHFPAEQLARAFGHLDAARNRVADIAITNAAYTPEQTPLSTYLELPGVFTFDETAAAQRAWDRLAKNELTELEFSRHRVVPIWSFVVPPFQFMMVDPEPITDLSQLQGKKIRVPGAGTDLAMSAIGAVGVRAPASDLYLALQRGTVDGTIISTQALWPYKLDEVLEAISTNASWGSVPFVALMHKETYDSLPEDVREAMEEAGRIAGANLVEVYLRNEFESNDQLRELGKTVFELPPQALEQIDAALQPLVASWLEQMEQRGLDGQFVIDTFSGYLQEELGSN